jgi:phosphoribosylformylglycinamidine synthase
VPIGTTGGDSIAFDLVGRGGRQSVSLADLRAAHEGFFPRLMGEDAALA